MKRSVVVSTAFLLLCIAAALPTEARTAPPADLASFLKSLDGKSACPAPNQTAAAKKGLRSITAFDVTCTASCGTYPAVSCTVSGTCSAVDRNCAAGQSGYVECNGSYTWCPPCGCSEGAVMYEDGGCCIGGRQRTNKYTCIDGSWELTGRFCGGTCW